MNGNRIRVVPMRVSMRMLCLAVLLLTISGCAGNSIDPPKLKDLGNFEKESHFSSEVRIQICLPNKRVHFEKIELDQLENHPLFTKYSQQQLELAPKVIRRVASSSDPASIRSYGIFFGEVLFSRGGFSDGSGFMPLRDSTVANQPVYERESGRPANEYVAAHVRLPRSNNEAESAITYWFILPKSIPVDKFSDWFPPISMEPKGERPANWWKLTHGGNMTIFPVSSDSPKMRVSLMKRNLTHSDPTTDDLPALTTARKKFETTPEDEQFVYEFVPRAVEMVAACN